MGTAWKRLMRAELPKWLSYTVIFLWLAVLLGCFYATLIIITNGDSPMERWSPTRPGHYELHRR
jgi:hypothetical protein